MLWSYLLSSWFQTSFFLKNSFYTLFFFTFFFFFLYYVFLLLFQSSVSLCLICTLDKQNLIMTDIHIQETSVVVVVPRIKRQPKVAGQFFYSPSDDGTDENLLILLHGLGLFPIITTI